MNDRIWLSVLIGSLVMLFSCSLFDKPAQPEDNGPGYGWRSAGLEFPNAYDSGGVVRLTTVGDYIVAMDAQKEVANDKYVFIRNLWLGKQGSNQWSQISYPKDNVFAWHQFSINDTYYAVLNSNDESQVAELWSFKPAEKNWEKVLDSATVPVDTSSQNYAGFFGAGSVSKQAFLMFGNRDKFYCWLGDLEPTRGSYIPCPGENHDVTPNKILPQKLNGFIYALDPYKGVFRWKPGMDVWDSLPSARGRSQPGMTDPCADLWAYATDETTLVFNGDTLVPLSCPTMSSTDEQRNECIYSMTSHENHLIIGYGCNESREHGIFRLEDDDTWTHLTPMHKTMGSTDTLRYADSPYQTYALLSTHGYLIAAGYFLALPIVYKPLDPGRPAFGDWRTLTEGWNHEIYGSNMYTFSIVALNDTIYAAANNYVAKLPVADIDSMNTLKFKEHVYPHLQEPE